MKEVEDNIGMDSILQLEGVTKTFTDVEAVKNVSFSVKRGEIFGFLGPNGAGKTTTIRTIMGIIAPDKGKISFCFDGEAGHRLAVQEDKKKVGYLPEERGIYSTTKVMETILYFADLKGADLQQAEKDAREWLLKLDLADYQDKKIEELSKGMQQKIQFIIAVIHRPQLVIFDELFSGLDPVNQELFKEIIKELRDQGTTVLLSSHRMNLVEELCDRIFLINKGQKVLYGSLDKIKDDFGVKKVWIRYRGEKKIKPSWPEIKDFTQDKNEICFTLPKGVKPGELLSQVLQDLEIEEIAVNKLSLHDIFIATVGDDKR